MSLTLSECYFQSCSTQGNYIVVKGKITTGNFFAVTSIVKFEEVLLNNKNNLDPEIPTDLPPEFTRIPNAIELYYSYPGTRAEGIETLRNLGAIEKQILAQ